MTEASSSSSPSRLQPPADVVSSENGEEAVGVFSGHRFDERATRGQADPHEGPSGGPASSDQEYPVIETSCLRYMLPSDMMISTDIQVAFSFVSALDICLTSFGDARTV
ncbi:hypothetical protein L3X38_004273 [Prunus dulcis]|uniref:Uncharacterized protein n=1 Tax=Prunus dulcis TaxID=3755 RepID=A0AAD4ZNJ8_PRUDU|nr:hypothetical protein L3X38_004273 [Prunus dulcis]